MRKYEELEKRMLSEVKTYLRKKEVDLTNKDEVYGALDDFCSDEIVRYMDENNLELMFWIDYYAGDIKINVSDL